MSIDRQSCNNENLSHRTMYNRCKYSTTKTRIQLNSRETETCPHSKNPSFPLPLNTNQFFQSQYGKKKVGQIVNIIVVSHFSRISSLSPWTTISKGSSRKILGCRYDPIFVPSSRFNYRFG